MERTPPVSVCRVLLSFGCLLGASVSARGATVPVGFQDRIVATGITSPTAMAVLPDGRVLVTQQNGRVRLLKDDVLAAADFYAVSGVDFSSERGLLGVLPDTSFATNGHVFLYYTASTPSPHQRILRVTASGDGVVPGSEVTILDLPPVPTGVKWHMGGAMRFGADGKLYVGVGNHEDSRRSDSNSAKLSSPFGKILRLNRDGTVPTDNPFYNTAGAYRAVWAYGLRNPFTFDIRADGLMYINDVGEATWEEVNLGQAAAHYGWPSVEGNGSDSRFVNPAYTYAQSPECAVVGAAFYQPAAQQFPSAFAGKFLFGDFCAGWIKRLDPSTRAVTSFVTGLTRLVTLGISPDGSLYYLDRNQHTGTPSTGRGTVGKITYTGSQAPRITQHPQDVTVYVGEPATFTVAALDASSYQWQRNGVDITGATATTYTLAATTASDNGARFRAVARNSFGTSASSDAILTVTTNRAPTATIVTPTAGTTVDPGDDVAFSGSGTDPEEGSLPPSAFTWQVDILHDTHAHPFMPATSGSTSGSFTVSQDHGDIANIWYRLYLTVQDSQERLNTAVRDVRPRTPLSDMAWAGTPTNGWGPVEKDMSVGGTAAGDGGTITLDGIPYAKGLGVHAPAEVRYALGGACAGSFIADVGVDDEVGAGLGSVVFQVWLDGLKAYDSGVLGRNDTRKAVNVSVLGRQELRLVVTDAGDGKSSDHADWAGARVTGCGSATPTATPTPTSPGPTPTPSPTPSPTPTPRPTAPGGLVEITPGAAAVTASTHDGNTPANTVDNNLATRWSGNGDGAWIQYDLGTVRTVAQVRVAVYNGNARRNRFDLQVSSGLSTWTTVWSGESSGTTTAEEIYDFADVDARWVRYIGHGSNVGTFNSVTEVSLFAPSTASPTPTMSPTPVPNLASFWLEAENGTLTAPMQTASDTAASAGRYIQVAAGNTSTAAPPAGGRATFTFDVIDSGTFKVWGRVIAPTTGDDSFWVQIDGGPWVNWNEISLGSAWHWDDVHDAAAGGTTKTWFLAPGPHTLTIAYREDGARLDRLLVTSDLAMVPTGVGP